MSSTRPLPDFLIVGAPRCGTTFMWRYLRQHPQVYMPRDKEPTFFATDLDSGSYQDSLAFMRDPAEYADLFAAARPDQLTGEASTWYLYSRSAAANIRAANPTARIIVHLRDPVEMLYSIHERRLYTGSEDLPSFEEALAAEADRRAGRRIPAQARNVSGLFYREVGRLGAQLERYLDEFGRDAVHVVVLEDLQADPARAYRETLAFLGLPEFEPDLAVVNSAAGRRSTTLHRLVRSAGALPAVRRLVPQRLRTGTRRSLNRLNRRRTERAPLEPRIAAALRRELQDDVVRLGQLLGRDFVDLWWSRPVDEPARRAEAPPG